MATGHFAQAIAHAKSGDKSTATEQLKKGIEIAEASFANLEGAKLANHMNDHWACCLIARLMMEEAQAAVEAVDSPTNDGS